MPQQAINPATLQALINANSASTSQPAYQLAGQPVYRAVSASGQVGGINSNGTPMALPAGATGAAPAVDYATMFAAIQKGISDYGVAKGQEQIAQGLMDSQVAPEIPEGYAPVAPNFRPLVLQFQPQAQRVIA